MDPIIAVWRYLHVYRGKLGENPKEFNKEMLDFYVNPDVKEFIRINELDKKLEDLVIFLQNRTNAWDYYMGSEKIWENETLFQIPSHVVRQAIEGAPLFNE